MFKLLLFTETYYVRYTGFIQTQFIKNKNLFVIITKEPASISYLNENDAYSLSTLKESFCRPDVLFENFRFVQI